MTDPQILATLVRWVASITGVTVIQAHQSGQRPATPYVMVDLTDVAQTGVHTPHVDFAETDNDNAAGEKIVTGVPALPLEWRFQVHSYGENATNVLRPLASVVHLPQLTEQLRPLIVFDVGRISDIPEWVNNEWEPRAVVQINLRGFASDAFTIDVIDEGFYKFQSENGESE